ncbi:YaaC family protein [Lentibacillus sediminis]|uniref:YaaC family protein n=1 Tax=Lentibacillus sediminis TaxID=1940529 RepID=UPI000C1BEF57|nr:YaaC family protein [Lentibacillus sediminis]
MDQAGTKAFYTYLQNLENSQSYLQACYEKLDMPGAGAKSFENSSRFMYYLEEGEMFLQEAERVDIRLQPLLYFYGLVHLLKACLLTSRPDYPESTSMLAHGVSARKRKKKDYTFLQDEVKIQQNGLFSYAAHHVFAIEFTTFSKIQMADLFGRIPEMSDFLSLGGSAPSVSIGRAGTTSLSFPHILLDSYHLTERAFISRISAYLPAILHADTKENTLNVELAEPLSSGTAPFQLHMEKQEIYFPKNRDAARPLPEVLVHYLLLYNLSMISRYETEYWGELFAAKADIDYSVICHYLRAAVGKIPFLVGEILKQGQ